jgi:IS5 family transposase
LPLRKPKLPERRPQAPDRLAIGLPIVLLDFELDLQLLYPGSPLRHRRRQNNEGKRDPEMHQSRKGNQWYYGMKVHIGVDKDSGLIHSVVTTAANVHDLTPAAELLHGDEEVVYADAGYQGIA